MTKYEAMREAIEVRINEMDEDDIITAWNDNEVGEHIYYIDDFDDLFCDYSPQGIAELASDCGWESWYDYFTYDGEIQQSNCIEDLVDLDDLVEYVLDEEDDLGDEEIRKALDGDVEYDEDDEEDE